MSEEYISLNQLANKGFHVSVPVVDQATWERIIAQDPSIPRTFSRLRDYGQLLYGPARREARRMVAGFPSVGSMRSLYEDCGEAPWHRLFQGLSNPYLTSAQREAIEADIDADIPTFNHSTDTAHFVLRWTDSSANASDNITDGAIVTETGGFLEDAWRRYNTVFGRAPYLPAGMSKIEVIFYDIAGAHGVASPDGSLQLNSHSWITTPGLRQSVSAHELFHMLEYAFGFRTSWDPPSIYKWFSEGLSSWAEVYMWQRVSRDTKITDMFTNPDLNLYDASYSSLPFWVFFEARQKSSATDNPILHFLTTCERLRDIYAALERVIDEEWAPNNVYGQLDNLYALFARERRIGAWRTGPTGGMYPTILAPNGTTITPTLRVTNVPLGLSDTYTVGGTVSQLGTDYYRLSFEPDANGRTLSFSVAGAAGGNFSYYLIWEKNRAWKRASFPAGISGSYSYSTTLNLTDANALVLAISGRGIGGAYSFNATIG